jgi:hypothetical protein
VEEEEKGEYISECTQQIAFGLAIACTHGLHHARLAGRGLTVPKPCCKRGIYIRMLARCGLCCTVAPPAEALMCHGRRYSSNSTTTSAVLVVVLIAPVHDGCVTEQLWMPWFSMLQCLMFLPSTVANPVP